MKKLLLLLFSIFFLSSPSVFAYDISDLKIEGMSIGDSLLDYMSEDEILKEIEATKNHYSDLKEPNKYAEVYFWKDFPTYDVVSVFVKNDFADLYVGNTNETYVLPAIRESIQYVGNTNEKFEIVFIRGLITFIEDFDSCIEKRDEISEILSSMFPDVQRTENTFDDSMKTSIIDSITLKFSSGALIDARCNDRDETYRIQNNYSEGLSIAILTEEIKDWFSDS